MILEKLFFQKTLRFKILLEMFGACFCSIQNGLKSSFPFFGTCFFFPFWFQIIWRQLNVFPKNLGPGLGHGFVGLVHGFRRDLAMTDALLQGTQLQSHHLWAVSEWLMFFKMFSKKQEMHLKKSEKINKLTSGQIMSNCLKKRKIMEMVDFQYPTV